MKWLITGGCGFIGTNLVKALVSQGGHLIRIIDNLSVGQREDLAAVCDFVEIDYKSLNKLQNTPNSSKVELVVGDILDDKLAMSVTKEIDVVVHLAASTGVAQSVENPRFDLTTNVVGTLNYLESAKENRIKRFILASSSSVIGDCIPPIHEEMVPRPVSPYGASKLACEAYCSAYFKSFALDTVVLRFGNVYGPRSKHKDSVVAKFFRQALNGEPLEIYGDGNQTRDFLYMDDLIQAIMLSVRTDTGGEIFQIATYKETTVNEIASAIKNLVEGETGKSVNIIYGNPRPGDVRRNYSDISKAKDVLGWEPEYDLNSGLKKTFEYFKQRIRV